MDPARFTEDESGSEVRTVYGHMAPDVKLSQWKTRAGGDWERGLLRSPGCCQDACGTGDLPGGGGVGVGGLPSHPATGRCEEKSVFEGRNGTQGMKTVLTACGREKGGCRHQLMLFSLTACLSSHPVSWFGS